jgi:serine/threonine-protein kinase
MQEAGNVRAQLARILSSGGFASSHRLCRFLRFIVERTLEADAERLKEFVVAMEVFDRGEDYDPNIDSIVRVEARRLRSKLKAYYEGPGRRDPVLIELRPGSYVPHFQALAQQETAACLPPGVPEAEYTTVAVLPFVNMSPEPEQDYFCDGITEEIIHALASVKNLGVVARTSAFQFKGKAADIREVGEKLGVRVVVEGSVRKAGSQLRITAQAIDAGNGYHLWSETYHRKLHDVFAIQDELSNAIANTLKAKLPERASASGRYAKPGLEAYTGYLKAMYLVHQQNIAGLHAAVDQFRQLIRSYPDYAAPYAGLAAAQGVLTLFGVVPASSVLPEMRRCAQEAVRLEADSGDACTVLAGIRGHYDFDWAQSEELFRRAISLQPGSAGARAWYGMMLVTQGRLTDAQNELEKVTQLNPLAASDHALAGYLHYLRGEDPQAIAHFEIARRLDPDFPEGRLYPALLHLRRREYAKAVEILSAGRDGTPFAVHLGLLGAAYGLWGKARESRDCLARLEALASERYATPLANAWVYLGLGDFDHAFGCLERAVADRTVFVQFVKVDPLYEPLRRDNRFARLLQSLNLPA